MEVRPDRLDDTAKRHLLWLLLGTENDWPVAVESLMRELGPVPDASGVTHHVDTKKVTIEPFSLRDKPRHSLVIDRLAYWYYVPREWLTRATEALLAPDEVRRGFLARADMCAVMWTSVRPHAAATEAQPVMSVIIRLASGSVPRFASISRRSTSMPSQTAQHWTEGHLDSRLQASLEQRLDRMVH